MSCTQEWRKCHICGDEVLWQTNGIGWHPIQYHDCKPVPRARLEQAERERDEARHERDEARAGRAEWEAVAIKYLSHKRERDEARAALAVERQHRDGHLPSCAGIDREEGRCGCGYLDGTAYRDMTARMEQATALLREVQDDSINGLTLGEARALYERVNAFLAGQPAPAKPVVDDAMVERARKVV